LHGRRRALARPLTHRYLKPLHLMNSVGDGSLQRVRCVSLDRATVSPTREKCRPHPPHGQAPVSCVELLSWRTHARSSLQNIRLSRWAHPGGSLAFGGLSAAPAAASHGPNAARIARIRPPKWLPQGHPSPLPGHPEHAPASLSAVKRGTNLIKITDVTGHRSLEIC
jgi:hypothetical protein